MGARAVIEIRILPVIDKAAKVSVVASDGHEKVIHEDGPRSARQWVMENIEPLEKAVRYISDLEAQLAGSNARIKELESRKAQVVVQHECSGDLPLCCRKEIDEVRNAALEEAAKMAEIPQAQYDQMVGMAQQVNLGGLPARIRGLKK